METVVCVWFLVYYLEYICNMYIYNHNARYTPTCSRGMSARLVTRHLLVFSPHPLFARVDPLMGLPAVVCAHAHTPLPPKMEAEVASSAPSFSFASRLPPPARAPEPCSDPPHRFRVYRASFATGQIVGKMQLYSVEQQLSHPIPGFAADFAEVTVRLPSRRAARAPARQSLRAQVEPGHPPGSSRT